jgi:hypothetical protein
MFWFFMIYNGAIMLPPYFYSLHGDIMAHIKNEEIKMLEEESKHEQMTSWSSLFSHTSDKKEEKYLTCSNGCCIWGVK